MFRPDGLVSAFALEFVVERLFDSVVLAQVVTSTEQLNVLND
jgi:hypothetical protein